MTPLLLGCIADDFTGATDLASSLVRAGLRVVQTLGVPTQPLSQPVDAVVVALKSRTIAPAQAVAQSLAALRWLQAQGAQQLYFKYCSTFDSTPQGNIGPVTEALMDALGTDFTIATPAFPDNQRTVFQGHLFVGSLPLNESGMQNHPLTPMRDANLVRVLQAQCRRPVGLIDYRCVAQGEAVVRARMAALREQGVGIAVADALSNADLLCLGRAVRGLPLVTAASGLAVGLPANWGLEPSAQAAVLPAAQGLRAVVCGSCSLATQRQVAAFQAAGGASFALHAPQLAAGEDQVAQALAWARTRLASQPVLIHSGAADLPAVQAELGGPRAAALLEQALAAVATGLVQMGVRQLVLAGGETSGACVQALGVAQLQIGAPIDTGVPWCYALGGAHGGLHLALKSGNFGADDFFLRAFSLLQTSSAP